MSPSLWLRHWLEGKAATRLQVKDIAESLA
jgi:hypothetical protein